MVPLVLNAPLRLALLVALAGGSAVLMVWQLERMPCRSAGGSGDSAGVVDLAHAAQVGQSISAQNSPQGMCDAGSVAMLTGSMALSATLVAALGVYWAVHRFVRMHTAFRAGMAFAVAAAVAVACGTAATGVLLTGARLPSDAVVSVMLRTLQYALALHLVAIAFFGIPWLDRGPDRRLERRTPESELP